MSNGKTRTLLTNGKFQGNNGSERIDQMLFAFVPNLYLSHFNSALNIGIGTGQTLAVIRHFGYARLEAVDIFPNIVRAAREMFGDINEDVLNDETVNVYYRDGRNHLLLNRQPYTLFLLKLAVFGLRRRVICIANSSTNYVRKISAQVEFCSSGCNCIIFLAKIWPRCSHRSIRYFPM